MMRRMTACREGVGEGLFCLQTDCRFLVGRRMLYHNYPLLNLLNGIPMLKRRSLALLPLCVLLAACSSKPKTPAETEMASGTGGFLLEPQHNVMQMGGDFANNPAADKNERNLIQLFKNGNPAQFAHVEQITGAIARRIECWVKPQQDIKTGAHLGLVRFGSQVAVYLPKDGARILVKEGQKVQGGVTVLGLWK